MSTPAGRPSTLPRARFGGLLWLVACTPRVAIDDDGGAGTGTGSETTGSTSQGPITPADTSAAPTGDDEGAADDWYDVAHEDPPSSELDVLFVIDNSGTMADAQLALVDSMSTFVPDLAARRDPRSVQVMVTTTDVSNPLCVQFQPRGYEPAHGGPVSSGCNARIDDFTGLGSNPHYRPDVCTGPCPVDVSPVDPFLAFDTGTGTSNAAAPGDSTELELAQYALSCMLPQGINGCGYESPLEAMMQAVNPDAAWNSGDNPFLRDGADLVIVLVSDEADCSIDDPAMMEDAAFWNVNPDNGNLQASSALCWNAGVTCAGPDADGVYSSCEVRDEPLLPITRYQGALTWLRDHGKRVSMVVLGGVPTGGIDELVYRDWQSSDILPAELELGVTADDLRFDFGIGPGCVGAASVDGGLRGLPSPRVFEVCQSLDDGCCIASICDGYGAALQCLQDFSAG